MASFLKKFKKLKVDPLAQWASSTAKRKQGKKEAAAAAATAAARAAVDVRNKALTEQYGRETELRGGLIAAQRGGLASTMLNLGGAGGDPSRPFASQLVGTQAEGARPVLEEYGPDVVAGKRKKSWFDYATTFGGGGDKPKSVSPSGSY